MTVGLMSLGTSEFVRPSGGGMQINTSQVSYFTGSIPVLNWWTVGNPLTVNSTLNGSVQGAAAWAATGTASPGGGTAYFNAATGDLNNPCPSDVTSISRIFFTPPPEYSEVALIPWWYGQQFLIKWTGTSVPTTVGSIGAGGSFTVTGANTATLTLGTTGTVNVGLTFPVTNKNDPPHSIVVYQSQYAANVAAGQFWNPDFVARLLPFKTLRTMKWNGGGQQYQSDISQFADANYNSFAQAFASTAMNAAWPTVPAVGAFSDFGPKAGVHPSLICALANLTGINPWYCVPVAISDATMLAVAQCFQENLNPNLVLTLQYGNEDWNFGAAGPFAYVNAQVYPGTGTTENPAPFTGYRSAQLWQIAHDTFGIGGRSRWRGCIDAQAANVGGVAVNVLDGAQYYLANAAPAGTTLADLFDDIVITSYFGNGAASATITGATAVGATTTLTATNAYIVGQVVRLFFSVTTAGTLGALLNNVDVTISARTSSSFSFTNYGGNSGSGTVGTTGLTYSAGTNYAADGLLFDLMDDSLTNFNSTPALYPTKYTYFTSQIFQCMLTGSADNGYTGQSGSFYSATGAEQHVLLAGSVGLSVRAYEGGFADISNSDDGNLQGNSQFLDYSTNYKFDAAQVNFPYNILGAYAANTAVWDAAFAFYQSQFVEAGEVPNPWAPVRFYPGDDGNPVWQAILAQNALGPFVDPTPAPTATAAYIATNFLNSSSLTQTFTANVGAAATYLVVCIVLQSSIAPTSVIDTTDGVTLNQDAANNSVFIYGGAIPAGSASRTITITWPSGAAFNSRSAFVYTFTGLTTEAPLTTGTGSNGIAQVSMTKGAFVVVSDLAENKIASPDVVGGYSTTFNIAPLFGTQSNGSGSFNQGLAAIFQPDFSSPIFGLFNLGNPGPACVATYR